MTEVMIDLARATLNRAYVPYSNFPVAAVVRAKSGQLYSGCNVENAAYPEGWCAETSAIAAMILAGERQIVEAAIMSRGTTLVTPCGGCRQRLREFSSLDTRVHLCDPRGICNTVTLGELLPLSFGAKHLR